MKIKRKLKILNVPYAENLTSPPQISGRRDKLTIFDLMLLWGLFIIVGIWGAMVITWIGHLVKWIIK